MDDTKLIFVDFVAYEEGSSEPFHGTAREFYSNGAIKKESSYLDGRLHGVTQTYDRNGEPWKKSTWENGAPKLITSNRITESYEFQTLIINFVANAQEATASVTAGKTVLKTFQDKDLDNLKATLRSFLKDPNSINEVIKENHKKFLETNHVEKWDEIGTFTSKIERETHCYSCKEDINSLFELSCNFCKWIICPCGACGCGYEKIEYT